VPGKQKAAGHALGGFVMLLLGAASGCAPIPGRENRLLRPGGTTLHRSEQSLEIAANQPVDANVMLLREPA
jgi:hypothetical protein